MKTTKKLFVLALMLLTAKGAVAQNKTLLIAESGRPYTEQSWFAYGSNDIEQNDITSAWDQGKRIVTAAYTGEGWFLIMAKNTPYTMQTYFLTPQWPEQWVEEKTKEGYAITSLSRSQDKWLIVMSQGSGISRQTIWQETWENLEPWIAQQKEQGYSVTDLAYDGKMWLVVMSLDSPYSSQGYFVTSSKDDLALKIQAEVWGKEYNLHQVEYGGGKYIVTFGNYARDNGRYQNLQVNPSAPKDYIRKQWEKGVCISYIGGGIAAWY